MQVEQIKMSKLDARELYQAYKKHQHYSTPVDWEIQRTYQLIAQGRMIVRALESIKAAGVGPQGMPKLAITRADQTVCLARVYSDGRCGMGLSERNWNQRVRGQGIGFKWPAGSFPPLTKHSWDAAQAMVPIIPIHLRPKRGIANYHILWEAEWERVVPRDPFLLRRIGKADLWLVVAAWDLTDVERAALSTRLNS